MTERSDEENNTIKTNQLMHLIGKKYEGDIKRENKLDLLQSKLG